MAVGMKVGRNYFDIDLHCQGLAGRCENWLGIDRVESVEKAEDAARANGWGIVEEMWFCPECYAEERGQPEGALVE